MDKPKPDQKVCFNCVNMNWMVGIGLGIRCSHESVYDKSSGKLPPTIPSRYYTCEHFEFLRKPEKDKNL